MDETIDVVIETPRGSQNKLKFDPRLERFRLGHVLPAGMVFPFDFGFVPETRAADGDPLDVLVLTDAALPMGCVVAVRLVGILEVRQVEEDGTVVENDRVIGVAQESTTHRETREIGDIGAPLLDQIEAFFGQYNRLDGKGFEVTHRRGAAAASERVRRSRTAAA